MITQDIYLGRSIRRISSNEKKKHLHKMKKKIPKFFYNQLSSQRCHSSGVIMLSIIKLKKILIASKFRNFFSHNSI